MTPAEPCPACHHQSLRLQLFGRDITKHYCYLCGYREYRDFTGVPVFSGMIGEFLLEKEVS